MEIQKSDLAERVKRLCIQKGILISDLERKAGYSVGIISRWAASKGAEFSVLSKLTAVADILEVSVDDLLGRQSEAQTLEALPDRPMEPAELLLLATSCGKLKWNELGLDCCEALGISQLQFSESKNGRSFADAWWSSEEECSFVLAAFCDDVSDTVEPMELELFYYVGHGLPLCRSDHAAPKVLQKLYVQLCAQRTLSKLQSRLFDRREEQRRRDDSDDMAS